MQFQLFNLFYYMTHAPLRFMNVYLSEIGLSATQIGTLQSIAQCLSLLAYPLWGFAADYYGSSKRMLLLCLSGTLLVSLLFMSTTNFIVLILLMALFALFQRPTRPLSDSLLLGHLGENSSSYGQYRVYGSLGYALIGPVFGWFLERTGVGNLFTGMAFLLLVSLLVAARLPEGESKRNGKKAGDFRVLLNNTNLMIFLAFAFLVQLACRFDGQFFPLYVIANGGRETLLGATMTIAAASELFVLPFTKPLIQRFRMEHLFLVAASSYGIRWLLLALFPTASVMLGSHVLHGLSFGLFHAGAVYFINETIGEEFRSMGQNLYATVTGVSSIAGSYIGGLLFDTLGGNNLYLFCGIGVITVGFLYAVVLASMGGKLKTEESK